MSLKHIVGAYLRACTTASLIFILSRFLLIGIIDIMGGTGFESATALDAMTKFQHLFFLGAFLFAISWIVSFSIAFIPFALGIAIAHYFKIRHWTYFVLGGVLTAIALEPLLISIPNLGINVQEPEPSFNEKFLTALPYFLASGASAGVSCYLYLRKGFIGSNCAAE